LPTCDDGSRPRSGPRTIAEQSDRVELGLLAGIFLGPLAQLVALVEQLDLLHFLEGLAEGGLGVLELDFELIGRALEVLPRCIAALA